MTLSSTRVHRDGHRLHLSGRLDRAAATLLWPQALAAADASTLDLSGVGAVDSAGLALLVALLERMGQPALEGLPEALEDLRSAYRLTPSLQFDYGQ